MRQRADFASVPCSSVSNTHISFTFAGKAFTMAPNTLSRGRVAAGSDRCLGSIVGSDVAKG
jgi:hypothetical protein